MPETKPPTVTFQEVTHCIYCGAREDLTDEHIIAFSLGGRFVLPRASCQSCARITGDLEQKTARDHLHIPRSIGDIQTRRPKERPQAVEILLKFQNGENSTERFCLEVAPIVNIIPFFVPTAPIFESDRLLSTCTLEACHMHDNEERFRNIFDRTNALRASVSSGGVDLSAWLRMLWKTACGFFFLVSPDSLSASGKPKSIVDIHSPESMTKNYTHAEIPNGAPLLFEDIFSEFSCSALGSKYGSALVYTNELDDHKWIYCELSILSILSFPKYTCRIRNFSGHSISKQEFALDGANSLHPVSPLFRISNK